MAKKLLLIEDMQGVRDSLKMILSLAGYDVDQAIDGEEGLNKAKSGQYDLIITDILLPKKDGSELIIEARQSGVNTPILAISAGGDGVSADEALSVAKEKANDILSKPFSKEDLLQKVSSMTA